MPRLLAVAAIVALTGCTGSDKATPAPALSAGPAQGGTFEPAPLVGPVDYRMPPDLRDRLCGDRRSADNPSFVTMTKAATSSFCL